MRVGAVLQVRMGSTRLPGKALRALAGRPVLHHVVERLSRARTLDTVVVATTTAPGDDVIEESLAGAFPEVPCFRGDEDDVLDRFHRAAEAHGLDVIARITADCPLIDPAVTDRVVGALLAAPDRYDFAANTMVRTWPRGLDTSVFKASILAAAWREATDPREREHVALHFHYNRDRFRMLSVEAEQDLSAHRWTLDTPEDLAFMEAVYGRLHQPDRAFSTGEVLALLEAEPAIRALNAGVHQKDVGA